MECRDHGGDAVSGGPRGSNRNLKRGDEFDVIWAKQAFEWRTD
jgi:hypothetical protein